MKFGTGLDLILDSSNISQLENMNGILIPGGFGNRGINGKILAVEYARKKNIPFLYLDRLLIPLFLYLV